MKTKTQKNTKDWQVKKLGEVCSMIKRGSQPKYTESKKALIVLNQKCIRYHRINYEFSRKHDSSLKKLQKKGISKSVMVL